MNTTATVTATQSRPPSRLNREAGQGLVEVALVIPVFLIMLMGLFDLGRLVFFYNTVSEAARNGARVAIVNQNLADICEVAAGRAVALGLPTVCQANANVDGVVTGKDGAGPNTSCADGDPTTPTINCVQWVTVTYTFQPITPIFGGFVGPIRVTSTSSLPVEYECTSGCAKP